MRLLRDVLQEHQIVYKKCVHRTERITGPMFGDQVARQDDQYACHEWAKTTLSGPSQLSVPCDRLPRKSTRTTSLEPIADGVRLEPLLAFQIVA